MGKLSKFLGTPKEIEIQGEKIKLYPLKVKDMSSFMNENMSKEEKYKMSIDIILKSLNDPDTTREEVEEMGTEVFVKLMDEINKLNGFDNANATRTQEKSITKR